MLYEVITRKYFRAMHSSHFAIDEYVTQAEKADKPLLQKVALDIKMERDFVLENQ